MRKPEQINEAVRIAVDDARAKWYHLDAIAHHDNQKAQASAANEAAAWSAWVEARDTFHKATP